jgi:hypothetical protein
MQLIKASTNIDPVEEIKSRAREVVLRAFDMGWQGPPFNPIQLAKLLSIDITPDASVTDAMIKPLGKNELQIRYNPFQKQSRINFSVSHEIGHTLFSDCIEEVRNRESNPKANRELEMLCNIAAAEIQLPYAIFSNDVNSVDLTIESIIGLAHKYEASLESTFLRVTEVTDSPCAFILGTFNEENNLVTDYRKMSSSFKNTLPENLEIPANSKACECIAPGWTARETIHWEILNNEPHLLYAIGLSMYKRDNRKRVGIFLRPVDDLPVRGQERKIILEYGDATKPRGGGKKIIAQVVNSSAGLGLGFGKSMAKNYPIIKEELEKWSRDKQKFRLGNTNLIRITDTLYVFQMLAQKGLYAKGDEIPLRYNYLRRCLTELRFVAIDLEASVHMPQIGAGQARGDWNIIAGMIHDELVNQGIDVNVYLLPGKTFNPKIQTSLTLFKETSTWQTGRLF